MKATMEDRLAIRRAVFSFREDAPMTSEDIRVACAADGHPLDHLNGLNIAGVLKRYAVPVNESGRHDRVWYRKKEEGEE